MPGAGHSTVNKIIVHLTWRMCPIGELKINDATNNSMR